MMIVEDSELKPDADTVPPKPDTAACTERARDAFAAMLDDVDVEDVFGEFIVPAAPTPPAPKQTSKA